MDLFAAFPLVSVLPQPDGGARYCGIIQVSTHEFMINILSPLAGSMKNASVEYGWETVKALKGCESVVEQRRGTASSVLVFLTELREMLLQVCLPQDGSVLGARGVKGAAYRDVVKEMQTMGWHHVTEISSDFRQIKLKEADQHQRIHYLTINLAAGHPVEAPSCLADLPVSFDFKWGPTSTLIQLLEHFQALIARFQELWNILEEIDSGTWVLEPLHPSFGSSMRRMALPENCSVQVEVSVVEARGVPVCRFLGPDAQVRALKAAFFSNIGSWHKEASFLDNLRRVLQIGAFPKRSTSQSTEGDLECGICYAMHAPETTDIADKVCDDARCGKVFHSTCLTEWLRTLPSTRQSFHTLFGECPYCSKPISVKAAFTA